MKHLTIQVLDTSKQWDGKVDVVYTNTSEHYIFMLSKTGLKYKDGKETKYLSRKTPITLSPRESISLTISIPFLIRPQVAYAFEDDVQITQK